MIDSFSEFRDIYGFELDDFQVRACRSIQAGRGVLVAAPTGSGKTVVGEFAIHQALSEGRKCFYTTPIKALSNQKYHDLVARYGESRVGLLTGDNSVNGEADIVVMTTEVLRNMMYAESATLHRLSYVVMDEVHYLADRFRGAVWEEIIINLPQTVSVVSLSATVSNAEEFGEWLRTVRGDTDVIVTEERPVPLRQHVMVGQRLVDVFSSPSSRKVNPQLLQYERGGRRGPYNRRRPGRRSSSAYTPDKPDVISTLANADLLPAIVFVFSRDGCDASVQRCARMGMRLTSSAQRRKIRAVIDEACADIPDDDLAVLGFDEWADALERGIAAHHAGMLPTFKEVVETLFVQGLVRVVFATETLSLGINMPARSVVLEKLVKWNGETHADITPAEYTQLTGRAGRRGIDEQGHAVVLWRPGFDASAVAGLAHKRTYPLKSSFQPSYNMATNVVGSVGRSTAREILESSFAQFQADRAVVGLAQKLRGNEEALEGYSEAMHCDRGDFSEYANIRQAIKDREKALAREHTAARCDMAERLRREGVKKPLPRRDGARRSAADDTQLAKLRREMREHPCHECPDREAHARWGRRWIKLKRESDRLTRHIGSRRNTISRQFDRVCAVLSDMNYLDGDLVTPEGKRLSRLYGELDVLAAECLRTGIWDDLDPAELAACVSALTFESRQPDDAASPHLPNGVVTQALGKTVHTWGELVELESRHQLQTLREPDLGFAHVAWRWARGHQLGSILHEADMSAGDFVRATRQLVDMLDQIAHAAENDALAEKARLAVSALQRGVVAYSTLG